LSKMTDVTANLALPELIAAQAQKHVTVNEALRTLDALVQLAVLDRDLTSPPEDPAEGARWIVASGASGGWDGHDDEVAAWQDGGWSFYAPQTGWLCYVVDEGALVAWTGSAWADAVFTPAALNNMAQLGVGTTADATNPFSAKLNNALWVAKTVAEGGDGTLRYKMSKESADKTLSVLFQDNFSGCAEIGLIGNDDLTIKVSPDGSAWHDAIVVDRSTGAPRFPAGGVREALQGNRTYYVSPAGSNANSGLSAGAPLQTIAAAVAKCYQIDSNGYGVSIQLADGVYEDPGAVISVERAIVGGARLEILGNPSSPGNVVVRGSYPATRIAAGANVGLRHLQIESSTTGSLLLADSKATVFIDNLIFTETQRSHIECVNGASVTVLGDYVIAGDAAGSHISLGTGATMDGSNRTMTLTGTLSFGGCFVGVSTGAAYAMWNATWTVTGTATGKRYAASLNGVINTFGKGASHFPGDAAGTASSGGQYA
jgi:hypothetical protein